MRRMRLTTALLAIGLLVACSSAPEEQHRSGSSPSVSPPSSAPTPNSVSQSGPCTVTRTWQTAARARLPAGLGARNLLGHGPVYPGVYTPQRRWRRDTVVEMDNPLNPGMPHPSGWLVQKVLWKISRDYRGPVWISGREVGGPARMKFPAGAGVSTVLHFKAQGSWPSESFVPHAGCYAWHVRGRGFHEVLMFHVVCVAGEGFRPCA